MNNVKRINILRLNATFGKEDEHNKNNRENLKELGITVKSEIKRIIPEIESTLNIINKLIDNIGGKEKLDELNSFLSTKTFESLKELEKQRDILNKYNRDNLRVKEITMALNELFKTYDYLIILKDFYHRIHREIMYNSQ